LDAADIDGITDDTDLSEVLNYFNTLRMNSIKSAIEESQAEYDRAHAALALLPPDSFSEEFVDRVKDYVEELTTTTDQSLAVLNNLTKKI
jgi:hypothetical protein